MNRDRLGRLATMLDDYREDGDAPAFDLEKWGEYVQKRSGFLWLKKHPCDTAACAVGLACLSGAFRAEGLRYERTGDLEICPTFAGKYDWRAVELFFELTPKQAGRLFAEGQYRVNAGEAGAKAVASRIRKMIAPRKRKPGKPKTDISTLTALLNAPQREHEPTI